MNYEFSSENTCPLALISLGTGESIKLERGSMVFHNGGITLEGRMNQNGSGLLGGIVRAAARRVVSGESFFVTTATSSAPDGLLAISPKTMGNIKALEVGKSTWRVNDGAFLACDNSVTYTMKKQSLGRAIFGKTGGLFIMETAGTGTLLVNGFGEVVELELDGNDTLTVDNNHVVAWENTLNYNLKIASGLFGFASGEGVVNEFSGRGKLLIQSKNFQEFAALIAPIVLRHYKK